MTCARALAFTAASWLLLAAAPTHPETPRRSGPAAAPSIHRNVLFIVVDDLNDWVGALGGHPRSHTPNIDRLAERGVIFTNAHAPAPQCNPSRTAVLTGISPTISGIYDNEQNWRKSPALREAITLPQYFRAHGYRAVGSGKIFHPPFSDPISWDEYAPALDAPMFPFPFRLRRNMNGLRRGEFDWGPLSTIVDMQMPDAKTVDYVAGQLRKHPDEPFFLAAGIFMPHLPWYLPARYFADLPLAAVQLPVVTEDDLVDVPPRGVEIARAGGDHRVVVESNQWQAAVRGYLAAISFADRQVGRLLDALDACDRGDDTIVLLWSDQGWHLGEKSHWRKNTLWEETTRVPLIISAPGVTAPGGRVEQPVGLIDIYPTLIDLAGLPPRSDLTGVTLRPLLTDPEAAWDRATLTTYGPGTHAVRGRHYRYIRYADGSEELYDHRNDPNEWRNLARDPLYEPIKKKLAGWIPETDAPRANAD
jgi:arylsulfatase A-like enzyme